MISAGNSENDMMPLDKARKIVYRMHHDFTEADAKDWIAHMTPPARWRMEDTTAAMKKQGYNCDPVEFYVVMNALFSDYGKTVIKYGADKVELWADLAYDFIHDAEAVDGKVGKYWRDIVRH